MNNYAEAALLAEIRQKCKENNPPSNGPNSFVLVVDDEEDVLNVQVAALSALGYQCLRACGGAEALEVAAENADQLLLLMTDIKMPDMSGIDLANKFERVCPQVPVLFVSGYSESEELAAKLEDRSALLLQKPFTLQELAARVSEALSAT